MTKQRAVYQLKITLRGMRPPVWRRIEVWEDITLAQLHRTLQIVMDWEDYHLHQFEIGRRIYGVPDPDDSMYDRQVVDEERTRLNAVVGQVGTLFEYQYDFGDDWYHDLLLEAIVMPEEQAVYPRCLGGKRRTPPEDVGGPHGFAEYLKALADPSHEEHQNMLEWRGTFDPKLFSCEEINQRLQKTFRARKRATKSASG